MRLLIGLFCVALLTGCESSEVTTMLNQSDSINIQFANSQTNNLTTDKTAIEKLAGFIGGNKKELPLECEPKPSGMIFFFQKGKPYQQVVFTDLSQRCRYFITKLNDQTVYSEVSNEAADFLTAIQQGKSTY